MQLTPQTIFGFLVVLWAFIDQASAARQPKAIWQTQCWDIKTTRAKSEDCGKAFRMMENSVMFGQSAHGPYHGCKEIFRVGDCGIEVCNQRPSGTHLALGAILAAAQIQESICRTRDGATGGITAIEGFEDKGEEHTYAEVHLATSSLTRKNQPPNAQYLDDRSALDTTSKKPRHGTTPGAKHTKIQKKRAITRRDEEWVRNTRFVVKEVWADWGSAVDGDVTRSVQSALTTGLYANWIRDLTPFNSAISATGSARDAYRHHWALTFHSSPSNYLNDIPIVDRQPIIDAFFALRHRIGRDHLGPPNAMQVSVVNEERDTVMGYLTMMMVGDIPELNTRIELPSLRGVMIQVTGSNIRP